MIKNTLRLQDQVLDMLNELGDVMRFENKTFKLQKSAFVMKELVQDVVKALWTQADKKNIKFILSLSEDKVLINADKLALIRVCTNIISNAIRFSPVNGTLRVEVHNITNDADEKRYCQIKITDSGPGIKEQDADKLFDRFFRIRKDLSSKGFGMGLYVARLFVEAHNGKIGVYNNREGGATFHFQIPI